MTSLLGLTVCYLFCLTKFVYILNIFCCWVGATSTLHKLKHSQKQFALSCWLPLKNEKLFKVRRYKVLIIMIILPNKFKINKCLQCLYKYTESVRSPFENVHSLLNLKWIQVRFCHLPTHNTPQCPSGIMF